MAWAMNKGVRNKYKDARDVDYGCTYIPYAELKDTPNLNALAEDGPIDEGSFPLFLQRLFLLSSRDRIDPLAHAPPPPLIATKPTFVHPEYPPTAVPSPIAQSFSGQIDHSLGTSFLISHQNELTR